jgi:hypothetical protein
MADFDNNSKNINDSREALDNYNESLRESIDLSKQLVRAVNALPSSLGLSESMNKKLIKGVNEYKESLGETLRLSNKVAAGRAKAKDIEDQIAILAAKQEKFAKENEASFGRRGRFTIKQRDLQREILALEDKEIERKQKIADADARIDTINQEINRQREIANSVISPTAKKTALDQLKLLQNQIKEEKNNIRIQDTLSTQSEKLLNQKKSEKETVDKSIETYKAIIKAYEEQIKGNETLLKQQKEQTLLGKLRSKDIETFNDGLREGAAFLSQFSGAFELVKKFAFGISEQVTKLQKGLVLSREEAYELRDSFNNIAVSSDDIAVNTNRLIEANAALGKQLGFNSRFTTDMNVQFVKLTKQIGLSEEAAGGLAKLSRATGITLEDAKNVALGTSQALSSQYGIQLDQREVLEEIGKISGQTLAFFKASPQAIAQAVAQAKLLGTNLGIASKQASSLLNFESSIESELQAELLTGRQLNLERARTAALTGDLTTVMQELNNQNIDFNKFSNMNAIAQNKVAEALGLSSDELADQLLKQQYLGKSREEIAALAGEEVAQRLEALSAQDKFNLAVEKMQDIVGRLIGGPFGKLVDGMASLAENAYVLYGTLGLIAGMSFVKLIAGLTASAVQAGILAAGTVTAASALTFGVAALGIAAGIGLIMAAYSSAKEDAQEFADGGVIYGKTKAIVGEYAGVENNPEVIAPLSDLQNILDRNRVVVNNQGSQETLSAIQMLNDTMKSVKEGISQLNSKEGIVNINGQRAGTAQLMGNYNLA